MYNLRFYFISVGVWAVLRILVSIKKVGQYKKFPWDKFENKKGHFAKHFPACEISLESQCLADDLVDFLEFWMFISISLP